MATIFRFAVIAALCCVATATTTAETRFLVWPPPRSIHTTGDPLPLHPDFVVQIDSNSALLADTIQRHRVALAAASPAASRDATRGLRALRLTVTDGDETVGPDTRYDYRLNVNATGAAIVASSVHAAAYALDTFVQLVHASGGRGALAHNHIAVDDGPMYKWRGLMIDAGRRFFPVPVVENLLDTMQANKLNVLHLHASDFCRFGVESKTYPNLTAALTGIHGGFYSQADVAALVAYAQALSLIHI